MATCYLLAVSTRRMERLDLAITRLSKSQVSEMARAQSAQYGVEICHSLTHLRHGDPVPPDRISRLFRALSADAGLPPIRLHDLRHGAATLALAAGGGPAGGP